MTLSQIVPDGPQFQIRHEVREIGPPEAARMLERVRNTSPLNQTQIATYARDMAAGQWKLNGEPVIFDRSGIVLSGRLRLHACVRSGTAFTTLIIRDIDPQHFDSIDALRRRTAADVMSIRREKDGRALAAALTVLWRFGNDDFPSISKRVSAQALVSLLEDNPEIRLSLQAARRAAPRLPTGLGAALHYMFSRVDAAKADAFFAEIASEERGGVSAIASLKKQLDESLDAGGMRSQSQLAGLTIKAWEAFRGGRAVSFVRYVPGTDQFPEISGISQLTKVSEGRGHEVANDHSGVPQRSLDVRVELVTPQLAQAILDRNDRNRAIGAAAVDKYARDMASGHWALNGQTIKISEEGRLLDGQHRCAAAIKAGTSFPAIIVGGLDETVFDTFDVGAKRSITAILKDRGETNTAVLGAVLRHVWAIEHELITTRNVPPSVSELLETLETHPEVRDSARLSNVVRDVAPSVVLALHYYFAKIDADRADYFIRKLADGVLLNADDPVYRLREIFLENRSTNKNKISDAEKAALSIKAWNYLLQRRPTRVLKWQTAGSRRESFPQILGRS